MMKYLLLFLMFWVVPATANIVYFSPPPGDGQTGFIRLGDNLGGHFAVDSCSNRDSISGAVIGKGDMVYMMRIEGQRNSTVNGVILDLKQLSNQTVGVCQKCTALSLPGQWVKSSNTACP